jgi:hypothetical protein
MRTTLSIQDNILDKAKNYSAKKGITIGEVFERALKLFLKEENQEKAHSFKLITMKGELVNPDINLDRTSELLNEDEELFRK